MLLLLLLHARCLVGAMLHTDVHVCASAIHPKGADQAGSLTILHACLFCIIISQKRARAHNTWEDMNAKTGFTTKKKLQHLNLSNPTMF